MYVVTIKTGKRIETVPEIQSILTEYGENIKARLGLHELCDEKENLIILVYCADTVKEFVEKLNNINNTKAKYMEM